MQANRNSHTTSTKCQYQAAASKPKWRVGRELAGDGAEQAHHQEDRADDDMEAVEARRHEEGRAVDRVEIADAGRERGMRRIGERHQRQMLKPKVKGAWLYS